MVSDSDVRSSWCPLLTTSAGCKHRDRFPLHLALSLSRFLPLVLLADMPLVVLDKPSDRDLPPYRLSSIELA